MESATGTIYGVLLNDRASLERLGPQLGQDPYKQPPRAPILYIKPANTLVGDGTLVRVPAAPGVLQIGSTIAAVISHTATRVPRASALAHIAGFLLVADLSLPHENYFRPAIRERCRDGFCPVGDSLHVADLDVHRTAITTSVNGLVAQTWSLANVIRRIDQLVCDVSEFMTLESGDLLLLGIADQQPTARPGDVVSVIAPGFEPLRFEVGVDDERALP